MPLRSSLTPSYSQGEGSECFRTQFYENYHKMADEHDKDFVKKHNDDLDTTLIFVRAMSFRPTHPNSCHRLVFFPPSLPHSSSKSFLTSGPIQTKRPSHCSGSLSTRSITRRSLTTLLPSRNGLAPRARSSRFRRFS